MAAAMSPFSLILEEANTAVLEPEASKRLCPVAGRLRDRFGRAITDLARLSDGPLQLQMRLLPDGQRRRSVYGVGNRRLSADGAAVCLAWGGEDPADRRRAAAAKGLVEMVRELAAMRTAYLPDGSFADGNGDSRSILR